jgi:hypothetical protein
MENFGPIAFAIGMLASGVLNVVNGNFYSPWDPVPTWIPGQTHPWLACLSGLVMALGGLGLLVKPLAKHSRAFAQFMDSAQTQAFIVLSKDAPRGVPRYLLPATMSAYAILVREAAFYGTLLAQIRHGYAMPTAGVGARGETIRDALLKAVGGR